MQKARGWEFKAVIHGFGKLLGCKMAEEQPEGGCSTMPVCQRGLECSCCILCSWSSSLGLLHILLADRLTDMELSYCLQGTSSAAVTGGKRTALALMGHVQEAVGTRAWLH